MNHDDAINAALLALAEAFKANMTRGRGVPGDFEEQARHFPRFVLDRIRDNQADQLGVDNETVMLPAPVLIQLVADAIRVPLLESQKADALSCRDASWNRLGRARKMMKKPGKHDAKARQALFLLGLVGEDAGKGGSRVNHRAVASHYHLLRTGGNYFENGKLIPVKPHSFTDAFNAIGKRYSPDKELDWESLVKACRRKKITLKKKAEVYPVD